MELAVAKRILISPWPYRMIRFVLGVVFVWAGLAKLADPEGFAEIISVYELVPESMLVPVAVGLPVLEVVAGLGLVFDVQGSLSIILGLLTLFVFVLWFGILRDLDIDCGCFSPTDLAEHMTLRQAMYRDFVMLAGALYLFWWRRTVPWWSPRGLRVRKL
jgi:uncharacterized membrane protein YphA (DoxX/SURF4 family)